MSDADNELILWLAWESEGPPYPFYAPSEWSMAQAYEAANKLFKHQFHNAFVKVSPAPIAIN